ncbi:MAG: hypothetical protein IKI05_08825, partial [Bacteroidaceae bacterium]|nr:hypothetical protein [Bacteroidaceae bacterium]
SAEEVCDIHPRKSVCRPRDREKVIGRLQACLSLSHYHTPPTLIESGRRHVDSGSLRFLFAAKG